MSLLWDEMLWRFISAILAIALVTPWFFRETDIRQSSGTFAESRASPSLSRSAIYPAEVLSIIDGDSFRARIALWPGHDVTTMVRVRGIDAPEQKARCSNERRKAGEARELLAELASEGLTITDLKLDKYGGRVLATVLLPDGTSVAEHMLATGSARHYQGKKRQGWCV